MTNEQEKTILEKRKQFIKLNSEISSLVFQHEILEIDREYQISYSVSSAGNSVNLDVYVKKDNYKFLYSESILNLRNIINKDTYEEGLESLNKSIMKLKEMKRVAKKYIKLNTIG